MPFDQAQSKWTPWNKGKLVGQKAPLKPQDVWAIRVRLELGNHKRDLALFNLAIDSTVLYLGVEVEDALALAESIEL